MRAKGMIDVHAVDLARKQLANAGAALVSEMAAFMPAIWPTHRYSEVTPDGVFEEDTDTVSAPNHPGETMVVPAWHDRGTGYDFGQAEADKLTLFNLWLFSRANVDFCTEYFGFTPLNVFRPFGSRADRSFEGGKFPRDQWKAGSFDVEAWNAGRRGIGSGVAEILIRLGQWNDENVVLTQRDWIITKQFNGLTVESQSPDTTFGNSPELLEDVDPAWDDFPAYIRVSDIVSPSDPTWMAAQFSFAKTRAFYDAMFQRLSSAAFAQDFFDSCFTLWRTGSQTRRRDSYE